MFAVKIGAFIKSKYSEINNLKHRSYTQRSLVKNKKIIYFFFIIFIFIQCIHKIFWLCCFLQYLLGGMLEVVDKTAREQTIHKAKHKYLSYTWSNWRNRFWWKNHRHRLKKPNSNRRKDGNFYIFATANTQKVVGSETSSSQDCHDLLTKLTGTNNKKKNKIKINIKIDRPNKAMRRCSSKSNFF